MSSLTPPSKPYSLKVAERIHNTTGKEYLPKICIAGFCLEAFWQTVIEPIVFKTPRYVTRKAVIRAVVAWPSIYAVTSAGIYWAAWRVARAEKAKNEKEF